MPAPLASDPAQRKRTRQARRDSRRNADVVVRRNGAEEGDADSESTDGEDDAPPRTRRYKADRPLTAKNAMLTDEQLAMKEQLRVRTHPSVRTYQTDCIFSAKLTRNCRHLPALTEIPAFVGRARANPPHLKPRAVACASTGRNR